MPCNNCNDDNVDCGCSQEALHISQVCNPIDCDTEECSEVFGAGCIIYNDDDIICNGTVLVTAGDSLAQAIANISAFFCSTEGVTADIECGIDVVVLADTPFGDALPQIVAYFCDAIANIVLTPGPQGPAGVDGINGIDGTNGIDGINGIDGTNGIDGINGIDGTNGTNGIDGTNGTDGIDGGVILFRSHGLTDGPNPIIPPVYVTALWPNNNDGLRITYIINETADSVGKTISFQVDGAPIFDWTAAADIVGVVKVEIIMTRSGNDMVGYGVAIGVTGGQLGVYTPINIANLFLNISMSMQITNNGTAVLKHGDVTIEKLLSI